MIQKIVDAEKTALFIHNYICNELHEKNDYEKTSLWLNDNLENKSVFVYEFYLQDCLTGVAIGSLFPDEISIDDIYCNDLKAIGEFLDFLGKEYKNIPVTFYFHQKEELFYQSFKEKNAIFETICHTFNFNRYLVQVKNQNKALSVLKYNPKYHKIIDKMKPTDKKMDLDLVYVVFNKRKPIGYIEISLFEDDHVYIEHFNILPKYDKIEVALKLLHHISNLYFDNAIDVILSAYDDEKIEWYKALGFEMEEDKTLIEAHFTF